jgi:hypothetical protein
MNIVFLHSMVIANIHNNNNKNDCMLDAYTKCMNETNGNKEEENLFIMCIHIEK